MHEVSLCESIVRIAQEQAKRDNFGVVRKIKIEIGEVSGASEESMRFCFPMVAKDTIAQDAELEFIQSHGVALRVVEMDVA
ncbi:MAG: hydrogenase maturation nickel metallochaperone HypA [Alphaproteobacteria bacterium]|nr:hydrogenase maturation nickel metallochaperone HypA [Alphaproteobacteria bacterium]